ncbi:MAG: hypothetical protein JJU45_09930 [Acidimicrobiia bacterium]|nr:hypothetical protein [Acidimicrobiia bacterium]
MPAADADPSDSSRPTEVLHLVRRFLGMLVPIGPRRSRREWAGSLLSDEEWALWCRMKPADRRHAVAVARRVDRSFGGDTPGAVLAAALLHDVGKIDSGLGVYGRTVATLSAAAIGRDPDIIRAWTRTTGFTRRVGLYLQHPRLGGDLLELAGSDPLVVAWARQHHLPADRQDRDLIPVEVAAALTAADDD